MVAELVRASYLIDAIFMLKVKGSNPGGGIFFAIKTVKISSPIIWPYMGKNGGIISGIIHAQPQFLEG